MICTNTTTDDPAGLLVIPTCQHAKLDLVQTGVQVEEEKDRLLENARIGIEYLLTCITTSQNTSLIQVVHGVCKGSVQQVDRQGSLG